MTTLEEVNQIPIPAGLGELLDEISINVLNNRPEDIFSFTAQYMDKKLLQRDFNTDTRDPPENSERGSLACQGDKIPSFGGTLSKAGISNIENDWTVQGHDHDENGQKVQGQVYGEHDQKVGQFSDETDNSEDVRLSLVADKWSIKAILFALDNCIQMYDKFYNVEEPEEGPMNKQLWRSASGSGLKDHLEQITSQICQHDFPPPDILSFCADYFEEKLKEREGQSELNVTTNPASGDIEGSVKAEVVTTEISPDLDLQQEDESEAKAHDKDGRRKGTPSMGRNAYPESSANFGNGDGLGNVDQDGTGISAVRRLIKLYEDITKFRNTGIILPNPLIYRTSIELKVPAPKIVLTPVPSLDSGFSDPSSREKSDCEERIRNWLMTSGPVKNNIAKWKNPKKSGLVQNWESLFSPLHRVHPRCDKLLKSLFRLVKYVKSKERLDKELELAGSHLVMVCFYSAAFQTQFEATLFPWLKELALNYPDVKFLWTKLQLQAWTTPCFWPILLFYKNSERIHEEQVTSLKVMEKTVPNLILKFTSS